MRLVKDGFLFHLHLVSEYIDRLRDIGRYIESRRPITRGRPFEHMSEYRPRSVASVGQDEKVPNNR